MMYSKFLFIFSATVLSAEASNGLSRNNRNETLWNKLTAYKDLSGISEEEMLSIWEKHEQIKVGEGNTFPKFRVAMSKPIPTGTVNPVFFDTVQFNEQIEYKNGVVLIMKPGYYTFTGQVRTTIQDGIIGLWIRVENARMAYGER